MSGNQISDNPYQSPPIVAELVEKPPVTEGKPASKLSVGEIIWRTFIVVLVGFMILISIMAWFG